eukprot:TRINITY_DN93775_c0_g1_i1.p1 TRINITY_DN93775_c0_g1~~TRINITY_DN93775_c0_g1_i1.p1  ORF type:complete len:609 (-),score=61.39 TRINITY_DN93775_c0_g1_i1:85-1911(-)
MWGAYGDPYASAGGYGYGYDDPHGYDAYGGSYGAYNTTGYNNYNQNYDAAPGSPRDAKKERKVRAKEQKKEEKLRKKEQKAATKQRKKTGQLQPYDPYAGDPNYGGRATPQNGYNDAYYPGRSTPQNAYAYDGYYAGRSTPQNYDDYSNSYGSGYGHGGYNGYSGGYDNGYGNAYDPYDPYGAYAQSTPLTPRGRSSNVDEYYQRGDAVPPTRSSGKRSHSANNRHVIPSGPYGAVDARGYPTFSTVVPSPQTGYRGGGNMRVFVGTFNMNGQTLTACDAQRWLAAASGADIVAIGFQEYGQPPAQPFPPPGNARLERDFCRGSVHPAKEQELFAALQGVLDPQMELVADVAMGESPIPYTGTPGTTWYGFIRTLVYVRGTIRSSSSVTVVPCGSTPSVADPTRKYKRKGSPDKGAVIVVLPEHNFAFVNCHLTGTNKHGVGESAFDQQRLAMLATISRSIPRGISRKVVFGDLNFRVEMHSDPHSHTAGGRDFQDTNSLIQTGQQLHLFQNYDRLRRYMATQNQPTLAGYQDATEHIARTTGYLHRPTFTFPQGQPPPRPYATKRTPSWTDRILWKGFQAFHLEHNSVEDVVCSDHVPVYAVWDMQM